MALPVTCFEQVHRPRVRRKPTSASAGEGLFRPLATALGNSSDNDGELGGNAGRFALTSDRDAAGSSLRRAARYRKGMMRTARAALPDRQVCS
jgi:hypothetical protein